MTDHPCPHCGRTWADRHPAAAVTAGLFTLVFTAMMLSTHPVAAAVLIGLAVVGVVVYRRDRERHRREAVAARADYEHAGLMARPLPSLPRLVKPSRPAAWHLVSLLPTTPMRR
jgi:hypothetical protein